MATADFQDRLNRIGAASQQSQPALASNGPEKRPAKKQVNHGWLAIGGGFIGFSVHMMRSANEKYEAIRDSSGIEMAAGMGIGAAVAGLMGALCVIRAVSGKNAEKTAIKAKRQASPKAQTFFSLLGLAFGGLVYFFLLVAAAARQIDTEKAEAVFAAAGLIVVLPTVLSLVFGLVGLFWRGRGYCRVPIYFVCGMFVTSLAAQVAGLNLLEWQPFVSFLQ